MNHQLLVAEFLATPWALMPERLNALAAVVMRWSAGIPAESENMIRIQADRVIRESRRQTAAVQSSGGIAVLPLYGVSPSAETWSTMFLALAAPAPSSFPRRYAS